MRIYVAMADGRVADGLEEFRLGLRLGQAVQTDTLISGLVGVAITRIGTAEVGAHLDQLSVYDGEHLTRIALEWLQKPDLLAQMLEAEKRGDRSFIEELRAADQEKMEKMVGLDPAKNDSDTLQTRSTLDEIGALRRTGGL